MARHGQTDLSERDEEVAYDNLTLLNRLSNIDKHRRVHLVASWPDLVYWTSDSPARQRWRWGNPPFEDGAILGRAHDDPEHPEPAPTTLHHELELRVLDPPEAGVNDVVGLLQSIHRHLSARVIPGVLNPYWLDSEGKSAQRAYGG